ncbi:MAG: carboxypeptidase M32 [Rhodobacteraceae bacterium]|jgi:carboxypeptidase Taq|uniref:Metal-dependent carboxypeptidase n=1 Tax=Salipiger profundus TaxID=1229727 RepID=A0A1U7DAP9_9RHOB|nr:MULTISPECIES: carboxypeptidase M32 [Salipiger]APX25188.1 carboxypeptidase Taq [Salipiger profundus]MAB05525.1 carboxypeptidase M32 [Paracoccaceae bacterium]GGA15956.1 carboxypeptidase Taq [Salipiger profundus]SFD08713.1 carboxypeptidase Taq [Salipiger profundus]
MSAFQDLMQFERDTGALAQVAGRLGWDQEVMMPPGAGEQRADEMAVMEAMLHARRTDPRVGEWLAVIDPGDLDDEGAAMVRQIRRTYDRSRRVPADLASALARLTSRAHRVWAEARADDDFAAFAPTLREVVRLKREEGAALADGGDVYDALLDDYEPGATAAQLSEMFGALRPRLVALRQAVLERPQPPALQGTFDEQAQMTLARTVAKTFGYEMARGRLDKSVHPFTSGGADDVRITTRTDALDPFNCLYSTIHEVGHAAYEQAVRRSYRFTPLGQGVSMGVHESQSRIYENQIGRSRAFTSWLYARMTEQFGDLGLADADAFYAAVNRVKNGYIRTEADEVQYNLHVLLRFDLERALIAGALEVDDLEDAWNERFLADFGFAVDKPSDGVLQDVHWSAGLFGYFPTYSLGNVYAGCLHKALRSDVPDLDAQMAAGDLGAATAWLRDNVQQFGGLFAPREVIQRACGDAPTEAPLLDYLEAKFGTIYSL